VDPTEGGDVSNPEDLARSYLVSRLEGDSELSGMINGVAPDRVWDTLRSPFVRVDYLDGEDLMVIGLHRIWADTTWHIRGCFHWTGAGQPDRTEVDAIGGRIDALLHAHTNVSATLEMHSFREEPTPIPSEVVNGRDLWLQSGGIYRLRARALAVV
jgi:hypothetical protein